MCPRVGRIAQQQEINGSFGLTASLERDAEYNRKEVDMEGPDLSLLLKNQLTDIDEQMVLLRDERCEGCDIVQSDHAPQAGVAQGIFDGELVRRRVGHQVELEEEQDEEVERRVRRDAQRTTHKCACMDDME